MVSLIRGPLLIGFHGHRAHAVIMVFMMEGIDAEGLILSLDWTLSLKASWVELHLTVYLGKQ